MGTKKLSISRSIPFPAKSPGLWGTVHRHCWPWAPWPTWSFGENGRKWDNEGNLVGGLVAIEFGIFPYILGCCHHPNWRTLIFFRGVALAHQPGPWIKHLGILWDHRVDLRVPAAAARPRKIVQPCFFWPGNGQWNSSPGTNPKPPSPPHIFRDTQRLWSSGQSAFRIAFINPYFFLGGGQVLGMLDPEDQGSWRILVEHICHVMVYVPKGPPKNLHCHKRQPN